MNPTTFSQPFFLIGILSLFMFSPPCWAEDAGADTVLVTGSASDMASCEATREGSPFAQLTSSVTPVAQPPDRRNFKITAIDPSQGLVTAQSIGTGEIIHFTAIPAALPHLRPGQMVNVNFIASNGARGRCACGQRADGSCWCTNDKACCGPLHGCPIASCDKSNLPGVGDKPVFQTPFEQKQ